MIELGADGLPQFVRWRIVVRPRALLGGLLVDLAFEIILQQAGVQPLEPWAVLRGVLLGVFLGIIMPSIGLAVAVRRANREIAEARTAVAEGAHHSVVAKEVAEAHAATGFAVARGADQESTSESRPKEERR